MTPPVLKNIRNFATIINQQPRINMDKKTIEEVIKGEVERGNFSVKGIAAKLFITPFTFRRQFERLFHESPKKYLQRARMNKAKQHRPYARLYRQIELQPSLPHRFRHHAL